MKQRADALERQNQQQAHVIRELKQDLENKRNIERKLRAELSSCESVRHTLQLALEDAKLSPKNLGGHDLISLTGLCFTFLNRRWFFRRDGRSRSEAE